MKNKNSIYKLNPIMTNVLECKNRTPLITVYTSTKNTYTDLQLFKSQIEVDGSGPLLKPYTSIKPKILLYRIIFLTLGVIYSLLGFILFFKSLTWTCTLLFGNCFLLKVLICSLCGASSTYCIAMGFLLNSEKEAVKQVFQQAKKRLYAAYKRKAVECGITPTMMFGENYRRALALRQVYYESLEKLKDYKEEAYHLLCRIEKSNSILSDKKEDLLNQATLECRDKMHLVIKCFSNIPNIT